MCSDDWKRQKIIKVCIKEPENHAHLPILFDYSKYI